MADKDLERLRLEDSQLVVILADAQVQDRDREDENNICRALALMRHQPDANLRLMLLRPENKHKAVCVGIRPQWCFSANELKSFMFAISCRCRGWSTLITNLLLSVSDREVEPAGEWWNAYQKGLCMEV